MKLDSFFQLFVVKEKKFYPLYISLAEKGVQVAQLLAVMVTKEDPKEREEIQIQIKRTETEADRVTATILDELYKTFVTPFDREDISTLATKMDSVIDIIHDASKKIAIYNPNRIDKDLSKFAAYILENANLLLEIMKELENMRKRYEVIIKHCDRIKEIEHEVDELYEIYISSLFANEKDAIELVKYKNIVQTLEDATDQAKRIADEIRTILIKQA